MDTLSAFARGQATRHKEPMVFDWDKAVKIIKERGLEYAEAGLAGDWEWTGGIILENGEPVSSEYMYLSSTWATPQLYDGESYIDCYIMASETEWDSKTKWPDSALEILNQ